jgi:hypothetical protein
VQPVVALLAVVIGIAATMSGEVLTGPAITAAGLAWTAVLQQRAEAYRRSLTAYDTSTICLTEHHVFA